MTPQNGYGTHSKRTADTDARCEHGLRGNHLADGSLVAGRSHLSGCFWLFAPKFWEVVWPTNCHFALKWMQLKWCRQSIDGGDTQTLLVGKKILNLMHPQAVGTEKFHNFTYLVKLSLPSILHWPSLERITACRLAEVTFFMLEVTFFETGVTFFDCKTLLTSFWKYLVTNVNNSDESREDICICICSVSVSSKKLRLVYSSH